MIKQLQANILAAGIAEKCDIKMDVVVHESIGSTNSWALQQCDTGKSLPFACFAEEQTQGRGRRGKHWLMPAGSNIAMSLAWPFLLSYPQINLLPLSVAIAITETLESFGLKHVQIKWPNDIYVNGKKIAGILIETQTIREKPSNINKVVIIIGVGLNYDMRALAEKKRQALPAFTDIYNEIGLQASENESDNSIDKKNKRINVASTLLQSIVNVCLNFQYDTKTNLEKFRSHYDYCKGKAVELILDDGQILEGVAQGVDDKAELLVMVDGKERSFNSADVSVKPGRS